MRLLTAAGSAYNGQVRSTSKQADHSKCRTQSQTIKQAPNQANPVGSRCCQRMTITPIHSLDILSNTRRVTVRREPERRKGELAGVGCLAGDEGARAAEGIPASGDRCRHCRLGRVAVDCHACLRTCWATIEVVRLAAITVLARELWATQSPRRQGFAGARGHRHGVADLAVVVIDHWFGSAFLLVLRMASRSFRGQGAHVGLRKSWLAKRC